MNENEATLAEAKRLAFVHDALVREWQSTAEPLHERLAEYARQRAAARVPSTPDTPPSS